MQRALPGRWIHLGESWRDFLEVLGQSTENSAVAFLNEIAKGLDFVKDNFDVISAAASAAVDVIVQPFVAIVEGIQLVTGPVDNFREQFRGALAIITKLLTDLTNNVLKPVFKFIGFLVAKIIELLGQLLSSMQVCCWGGQNHRWCPRQDCGGCRGVH